ncbi:MMPL family transporter [Paenibacillus sinopodophylli]|uniref:MMPL family transporter n=1 Tax=Paenibacillus sinopodophylli TaxID=1837342 RepID=UPI00110CE6D9|nr:MMPL family transporter [Paenibacillus sinopodophylli]
MNRWLHTFSGVITSPRGAKISLICWLSIIILLTALAPGAKEYAISSSEGSVFQTAPSAQAEALLLQYAPAEQGQKALLVFHSVAKVTATELTGLVQYSEWLASEEKPALVASSLPYHLLPVEAREKLMSTDRTTLLLPVTLHSGIDSNQNYSTLQQLRDQMSEIPMGTLALDITGPAGIAADTISLFRNADIVLMLATVLLILMILLVIYRSPLLALVPLMLAGAVYAVVDRLLGLAGQNGWFVVDKQALSIMMILLFAVLTDYCLFIFSRYREELASGASKHNAMQKAMERMAEPIVFSGGTVLAAMLALLAATFEPYHHFAPVFAAAMVVILLAGLTLIPPVFALLGRRAFWPSRLNAAISEPKQSRFWSSISALVVKRPALVASVLLVALLAAASPIAGLTYSFNLMKSFPEDLSSREGFEVLAERYPAGQLAPVTLLLAPSDKQISDDSQLAKKLLKLKEAIEQQTGGRIAEPAVPASADSLNGSYKLELVLEENPYEEEALDKVTELRQEAGRLLTESGLADEYALHIAGQTSKQVDVRHMNERDTLVLLLLIPLLLGVMLWLQSRSVLMGVLMLGTMLVSYGAALGLTWLISQQLLGLEAISYRMPVYTFVFLVALGVDYNIMLISRIREEAASYEWTEAVRRGVSLTGGVISSAGFILAATFAVLITQPMQELYLFGLAMALGILMDTLLIRGMLLPALLVLLGGRFSKSSVNG